MNKLLAAALLGSTLLAVPATAQPPEAAAPAATAPTARLSVNTGIKALLADEKSKAVLAKYAPMVVEFFASGQAEGMVPGETPLAVIAENPMAAENGLSPENMTKIAEELAGL
jgi:hypothetical protein